MSAIRRAIGILLIAVGLAAQPVKPAHAFTPEFIAAVTFVGQQLLSVVTGGGKLDAVLLAIESWLPTALSTVEMKTNENIHKARAALAKQKLERQANRESARELPADIMGGNCQIMTGFDDANAVDTRSKTVIQPMIQHNLQNTVTSGGVISGRSSQYNMKPKPTDAILAAKQERRNQVCRYGNENALKEMQALGCKDANGTPITTVEQIRANRHRSADIKATTLLNGEDVKDDKDYLSAMDYCTNVTGNRPFLHAQGRALSEDLGNIQKFLLTLSDNASRDVATLSCAQMVRNITPLNGKIANETADWRKLMAYTQDTSAVAGRTTDQISTQAKDYLVAGLGYRNISAAQAKKEEADYAAALLTDPKASPPLPYVIKEQQVSLRQNDMAIYVARWFDPAFKAKLKGNTAAQTTALLASRIASLQLLWRQYEELERQSLTDAVSLARMVRAAPGYGDPPPVSSMR